MFDPGAGHHRGRGCGRRVSPRHPGRGRERRLRVSRAVDQKRTWKARGQGCPEAILAQNLPGAHEVRDSQAFGRGAQVLMDGDVVFLLFGNRWLITAAGCQPRGDRPYDCTLKGG